MIQNVNMSRNNTKNTPERLHFNPPNPVSCTDS